MRETTVNKLLEKSSLILFSDEGIDCTLHGNMTKLQVSRLFIFTSNFHFKAQHLNSRYRLLHISFYASSGNLVLHQDRFP